MAMKQSRRSERPLQPATPQGADRRTEPRIAATGDVSLRESGILNAPFPGQLVDIAEHGFRARHKRLTLTCGQIVHFEFEDRSGEACAMWTRITGSEAESGFRILPEERGRV